MLPESGDFLLFQFSSKKVECQPEPPWIKRCSYGIKFTDDLQFVEDIDFCSSTERKSKKEDETSEDEQKQESELKVAVKAKAISHKKVEKKIDK